MNESPQISTLDIGSSQIHTPQIARLQVTIVQI